MPGLAACHGRQRAEEQQHGEQRPTAPVAKGKMQAADLATLDAMAGLILIGSSARGFPYGPLPYHDGIPGQQHDVLPSCWRMTIASFLANSVRRPATMETLRILSSLTCSQANLIPTRQRPLLLPRVELMKIS